MPPPGLRNCASVCDQIRVTLTLTVTVTSSVTARTHVAHTHAIAHAAGATGRVTTGKLTTAGKAAAGRPVTAWKSAALFSRTLPGRFTILFAHDLTALPHCLAVRLGKPSWTAALDVPAPSRCELFVGHAFESVLPGLALLFGGGGPLRSLIGVV